MKVVYSKPNCPGCDKLKKEYIREGIEFEERIIGKDITVDEFCERFPRVRTVPYVREE